MHVMENFSSIPFSLNNKLQVKSKVERETYKLKVTEEASARNNGPTSYRVWFQQWWRRFFSEMSHNMLTQTTSLMIFRNLGYFSGLINVVIPPPPPQRFPYRLEKTSGMLTDELIWGLGSAPQYSGVGLGLAEGRSKDAPRLAIRCSWLKLGTWGFITVCSLFLQIFVIVY